MSLVWSLSRLLFQDAPATRPSPREQNGEKHGMILRCLQGQSCTNSNNSNNNDQQLDDNSFIDLWELRELALSSGGLLDASVRKRAWPILTSCHTAILDGTCAAPHRTVPLSQSDLRTMRHDVKQTVWDITEYLRSKPQGQNQGFSEAFASNSNSQRDTRRVSFLADKRHLSCGTISEELEEEMDTVPPIRLSPTDGSDDETSSDVNSGTITKTISCDDCSAVSALKTSYVSHGTGTSSLSGRRVRWRKASKFEQNIVANVITSVLRTPAQEHSSFADDRFHYYTGLHNLTAILLANLESPSLTSMVLGKLAVYHLRDAMRQDTSVSECALRMTLFPLLQRVDPSLYNHICVRSGLWEPGFALSWVTAWFASDVGNLAVASRLIDVFLVSHPLMPVYCVVALLVSQRKRLLSSDPSLKSLYANLRSLKLMATLTMSNDEKACIQAMNQTEEIVASALRFIKQVPPQTLIQSTHNSKEASRRSVIVMLSETSSPSWCVKDTCPTEWGVLQRAKAIRSGEIPPEAHTSSQNNDHVKYHSNAFAAAGYKTSKMARDISSPFVRRVLALLGLTAAALVSFSNNSSARYSSTGRIGLLTPTSNPQTEPFVPIFYSADEPPTVRTNSSDVLDDESTLVESDQFHGNWVVAFYMRHEDENVTPFTMYSPVYELTDSERDFERFVLKPLHVTIGKIANAVFTIIHHRPKGKATIIVPATFVNLDGWAPTIPAYQISGPVDFDATTNVDLAKHATALYTDESFAIVRYNQTSTKTTRSAHMKVFKEKVVSQTKQAVKMGIQALLVSLQAVRSTIAIHAAQFDVNAFPE